MIRLLLIEDEPAARDAFRDLVSPLDGCVLIGEARNFGEAARLLAEDNYDIAFLDIQLIGGSGFDLIPHVRPQARLVFITAYEHHAIRAFEVNALDYLLKPVRPERLLDTLRRVAPMANSSAPISLGPDDSVFLKTDTRSSRFVRLTDLVLVRSCGNYSEAHTVRGERLFVRKSMKEWELQLPTTHFARVHRETILNLRRITRLERVSLATTHLHVEGLPDPVPASYRYLATLRDRLKALG